jgi:hypothetical protein
MRIPYLLLLAICFHACTAQKQYQLVLNVTNGPGQTGQLDSAVAVLKKRLAPYDKGDTKAAVSPDGKSITLQTACGDKGFINGALLKQGQLLFFECYTLENMELVQALQEADKAMAALVAQGQPSAEGMPLTALQKDNPLFHLLNPVQPYEDKNTGRYNFPPGVFQIFANIMTELTELPNLRFGGAS